MELLLEGERDDDNIMDMINAKIQLSLEIDKDELFWEHKARANWLRVRKNGWMTLKLDMSKAYDRVELNFLKLMMEQMGFANGWVETIMRCILSVSYSVVLNVKVGKRSTPSRGLQQDKILRIPLVELDHEDIVVWKGLVARNTKGDILASRTVLHGNIASPFATEALACSQTTALGRRFWVNIVEIEGD
ncbi:hypothetical protein PVK06_043824 [Gossypium arboreum]|uniref:Reverse transcriptase n=1 Tax=Gossypium arboreum TaxID=29729 RepID=A0ABR0MPL2_GOSAR|nr:hypothetical protein PVK06_043824 [Gossypium arboreum]